MMPTQVPPGHEDGREDEQTARMNNLLLEQISDDKCREVNNEIEHRMLLQKNNTARKVEELKKIFPEFAE